METHSLYIYIYIFCAVVSSEFLALFCIFYQIWMIFKQMYLTYNKRADDITILA